VIHSPNKHRVWGSRLYLVNATLELPQWWQQKLLCTRHVTSFVLKPIIMTSRLLSTMLLLGSRSGCVVYANAQRAVIGVLRYRKLLKTFLRYRLTYRLLKKSWNNKLPKPRNKQNKNAWNKTLPYRSPFVGTSFRPGRWHWTMPSTTWNW